MAVWDCLLRLRRDGERAGQPSGVALVVPRGQVGSLADRARSAESRRHMNEEQGE